MRYGKVRSDSYGYCPKLRKNVTVQVEFLEIPVIGSANPEHKRGNLLCEYAENFGCETGITMQGVPLCPLYESANP